MLCWCLCPSRIGIYVDVNYNLYILNMGEEEEGRVVCLRPANEFMAEARFKPRTSCFIAQSFGQYVTSALKSILKVNNTKQHSKINFLWYMY